MQQLTAVEMLKRAKIVQQHTTYVACNSSKSSGLGICFAQEN